jgi:hypothetical protein
MRRSHPSATRLEWRPPDAHGRDGVLALASLSMEPTARLARRIRDDFGDDAELVLAALPELPGYAASERVQAAVVKLADGDLGELDRQLREARIDWRDVLVAAGFAHEDWPERLDDFLGSNGLEA